MYWSAAGKNITHYTLEITVLCTILVLFKHGKNMHASDIDRTLKSLWCNRTVSPNMAEVLMWSSMCHNFKILYKSHVHSLLTYMVEFLLLHPLNNLILQKHWHKLGQKWESTSFPSLWYPLKKSGVRLEPRCLTEVYAYAQTFLQLWLVDQVAWKCQQLVSHRAEKHNQEQQNM